LGLRKPNLTEKERKKRREETKSDEQPQILETCRLGLFTGALRRLFFSVFLSSLWKQGKMKETTHRGKGNPPGAGGGVSLIKSTETTPQR